MLGISNIYLSKLRKGDIKLYQVPKMAINQEMCDYWAKYHFEFFEQIPEKYRKPEMGIEAVKQNADHFQKLPIELRTKEVYEFIFEKAIRQLDKVIQKKKGKLEEEINETKIISFGNMVIESINPSELEKLSEEDQQSYKKIKNKLKMIENPSDFKLDEKEQDSNEGNKDSNEDDEDSIQNLEKQLMEDATKEKETPEEKNVSQEDTEKSSENSTDVKEDDKRGEEEYTTAEEIKKDPAPEKEEEKTVKSDEKVAGNNEKTNETKEEPVEKSPFQEIIERRPGISEKLFEIPLKDRTKEMYEKAYMWCPDDEIEIVLESMPEEMFDEKIGKYIVSRVPLLIINIPEKCRTSKIYELSIKGCEQENLEKIIENIPSEAYDDVVGMAIVRKNAEFINKVPEEHRTSEMYEICLKNCDEEDFELILDNIPDNLFNDEIGKAIVRKNAEFINRIPEEHRTSEMYEICLENCDEEELEQILENIPEDLFNDEICKRIVRKDAKFITKIPEKYRTIEIYKEAFDNCNKNEIEEIFESMPYGMSDQDISNYLVSINPDLISKIPVDMINQKMYKYIKNSENISSEFLKKYFGKIYDEDKNEDNNTNEEN